MRSVASECFIDRADFAGECGQIKKIGIRAAFPTYFRHRHHLIEEGAGKNVSGHAHTDYCAISQELLAKVAAGEGRLEIETPDRFAQRVNDLQIEMQLRQIPAPTAYHFGDARWPEDIIGIQKNDEIATAS